MLTPLIIAFFAFASVVLEHIFVDVTGGWFRPNLVIILVVFFNLFRGVRYGIFAALVGGLLKDSFSTTPFGIQIFSLIACAYLATFVKIYIYQPGSRVSRVLIVFVMSMASIIFGYVLNALSFGMSFGDAFKHVMIPELAATVLAANYYFERLKKCALRLFA